jgi:hypothetical protein
MLLEIVQLRNTIHQMSQFWVKGRILNYADQNGQVTDLLLDHYAEMALSGMAVVVVEETSRRIPSGSSCWPDRRQSVRRFHYPSSAFWCCGSAQDTHLSETEPLSSLFK